MNHKIFGIKIIALSTGHHTILCSQKANMKVLILLAITTVALASLEPAGYRPPGSSPSSRYLPAHQSSQNSISSPSNQYLPANRYTGASSYQTPSNQYLPANRYSTLTSSETPSNQYLPANKYSSLQVSQTYETPVNEYLPPSGNRDTSAGIHQETPSNRYLPASANREIAASSARQWLANRADVGSSSRYTGAVSNQYLPAAFGTQQKLAQPSNIYLPAPTRYSAPGHSASSSSSSRYSAGSIAAPSNQYLPANQYASSNNGYGYHSAEDSVPAKYEFEYEVKDESSGNDFGHKESRDGDNTQGVYTVVLPDGRKQIVEYQADQEGYKPRISYEELKQGYNNAYNRQGGYAQGYPQGPY